MKKHELEQLLATERQKAAAGSAGNSTGLAAEITAAVLNTPDAELPRYTSDGKGGYTVSRTTPVKDFRDATAAAAAKVLGLDRQETAKLADGIKFNAAYGRTFNETAALTEAAYLSTGRALNKPQLGPDVSRASIRLKKVEAKSEATTKIVKDEATGTYKSVPTGQIGHTAEHKVLVARSVTREWAKTSTPDKSKK